MSTPLIILSVLTAVLLILLHVFIFRSRRTKKRYEADIRRTNEAKLRFYTEISSDLRTPLSLIISPLEKIIDEHQGDPITQELEDVEKNARILMDEIDRILEFKLLTGKVPDFHPSYGDIARFTSEVCRSYVAYYAKKGDSLTIETDDSPIMTSFDRDKIRRVISSILGHIYKHGRDGNEALEVRIKVHQEDGWAIMTIYDNGKSLDDKTKQFIMDKIDNNEDWETYGYSIGLDIIKEYVHRHKGKISLSDNHPKGRISTFAIPISEEMKPSGKAAEDNTPIKRTGRPLILNVEDNPAFRFYLTESLSSRYDIVEAGNGKEAMELLSDNNFDLILSDVVMPVMDGRELCRNIRSDIRYSGIPIILHTTIQDEDAELNNLKAGADDTLKKPFNIESLIIRIDRLIKRRSSIVTDTDASGRKISRADRELLDRVAAEIEKNLQDSEYTIESLCTALSISRSGLYKKMVILTGKSPLEYLRIMRLEKGRDMLDNGETSISQIAWNVGYSPKQFSKHFKDEFGCLPSEYIHSISE
jgi:DNA-binding response OmpR family regulator